MSEKLKVFSGCFDGTMDLVVAAPTKKAAAERLRVSLYALNTWGSETGNDVEVAAATGKPGAVFCRPSSHFGAPLVEGEVRWRRGEPWPPLTQPSDS